MLNLNYLCHKVETTKWYKIPLSLFRRKVEYFITLIRNSWTISKLQYKLKIFSVPFALMWPHVISLNTIILYSPSTSWTTPATNKGFIGHRPSRGGKQLWYFYFMIIFPSSCSQGVNRNCRNSVRFSWDLKSCWMFSVLLS